MAVKRGGSLGRGELACGYVEKSSPLTRPIGLRSLETRPFDVGYATSLVESAMPSRYASAGVRPASAECGRSSL